MRNVYDILEERGFIEQATHPEDIREVLGQGPATFYIGFDATADSLTAGHFLTVMAMMHMQRAGHRPIALLGGGTTLIGDPTGKSDMRRMLTREQVNDNAMHFKEQLSKYVDFSEGKAILENNADWLLDLNYVTFLREVGVHFSVNRMLTAECYRARMEKGLTFLEFNYMLMQSYDFYVLHEKYGCCLELGGNDQWSNIIGGVELIRRKINKPAYGLTFTLLTTSEGKKMGKTEKGALWLDPNKTSPYDFYQYWRNVEDSNVGKCLGLLTFLPMEEVRSLSNLKDSQINRAKEVLAYEITKIVHGREEADKAQAAAKSLFMGAGADDGAMPSTVLSETEAAELDMIGLLVKTGLAATRSEGRRLITQGGIKAAGQKVESIDMPVSLSLFEQERSLLLQKGKKVYHKVTLR